MDLRRLGVLIADREDRSMVLKTPLRVIGVDHTYEAAHGAQVLEQLHAHSIDVLIAGYDLPPTGLVRLIEHMRSGPADHSNLAIIAVIPAGHQAEGELALKAGAHRIVTDPIFLHDLEQAILAAVGQTGKISHTV